MWQVGAGDLPRAKCPVPSQVIQVRCTAGTRGHILEVSQGGLRAAAASPGGSAGAQRREVGLRLLSAQPGNLGRRVPGTEENKEGDSEPGRGPLEPWVERRASHSLAISFGFVAKPLSAPVALGPAQLGLPCPHPTL